MKELKNVMIENIIGSWIRRSLIEEYILKPGGDAKTQKAISRRV